jgi:Fe-Mn family superoxide dismutase
MSATPQPTHAVGPYDLPPLRFGYGDLAPVIGEATLRHHHLVVHKAYVDAVNATLARRPEYLGKTIETLLRGLNDLPDDIRDDVREKGGGHADHQFFWKILSPPAERRPAGPLAAAIDATYGSFEAFKARFEAAALAHEGRGWAFLSILPKSGFALKILTLPDNGSVLSQPEPSPGLIICDLWDHASEPFGGRAEWLRAYWSLVDWAYVGERFTGVHEGRSHL